MAKNSQSNRTAPIDVAAPDSTGVIAAWQGLYHAFGARFESVAATVEGLLITGLTFDAQYDAETVIRDVNVKGRRVQLFPTILWINGEAPEAFVDAQEMTTWQVANYRGTVEGGATRTPEYVRKAFAALKASMGIASKRGPKPKTINLKKMGNFNADVLRNAKVSSEDLALLIAAATEAQASLVAESEAEAVAEVSS